VDAHEFERWREEADSALRGAGLQAQADLHDWACSAAEPATQLGVVLVVSDALPERLREALDGAPGT